VWLARRICCLFFTGKYDTIRFKSFLYLNFHTNFLTYNCNLTLKICDTIEWKMWYTAMHSVCLSKIWDFTIYINRAKKHSQHIKPPNFYPSLEKKHRQQHQYLNTQKVHRNATT
jgi:hypothetical protein